MLPYLIIIFRLNENLPTSPVYKMVPRKKVLYCNAQVVTGMSHRYTQYGSQETLSGAGSQSTGAVL